MPDFLSPIGRGSGGSTAPSRDRLDQREGAACVLDMQRLDEAALDADRALAGGLASA